MTHRYWIALVALLLVLPLGNSAFGCTLGAWLGGASGDAMAAGVEDAPALPRVHGLCAMAATNGFVQDNSPASVTRMSTRFYFLKRVPGSATIFRALSDEPAIGAAGATIYEIRFNANDDTLIVDASAAGGGTTSRIDTSDFEGWISIEVDWEQNASMSVWIGTDATSAPATATVAAGSGSIDAVRLGAMNVTAGVPDFVFDDYEARDSVAVGLLVAGDANDDGAISIFDSLTIRQEILGLAFAEGIADCNLDAVVSIRDAVCSVDIALNRRKHFLAKGGVIFFDSFETP